MGDDHGPKMDKAPEESTVSADPLHPRPRDKTPERTYSTEVREQAAIVGPGKGGAAPVTIGAKGGDRARPDDKAAGQGGRQPASGKGEGDTPSLAKE
jgi:hypothetical protein